MSVDTGVAVLVPAGGARARSGQEERAEAKPFVLLASFAALGLYGTLRWAAMLTPSPVWRPLGLLAVAVALAGAGMTIAGRSRAGLVVLGIIAFIAILPLGGIPLSWVRHARVSVTADVIGEGISALPRALVPYAGVNEALRIVIELGAGALLLTGALILAGARGPVSDLRRAAAALPLVVLAIVPSTLTRPSLAYAHGLVLFALLAAFFWADRLRRDAAVPAFCLAALAVAAAMVAAPALDEHSPWLNYQALTGSLAPGHPETFDWRQRYGPLHWPRAGREVLDVQAQQPDYWKAENLDSFDGWSWVSAGAPTPDPDYSIDPGNLTRWTQTLHVTLRAMRTTDVVAAGDAQEPSHISAPLLAGASNGTWTVPGGLAPGDSYTVSAYTPRPSAAELASAGSDYPDVLLPAYVSLTVPAASAVAQATPFTRPPAASVTFPSFGSPRPTGVPVSKLYPGPQMAVSAYARAYALARRLVRGAQTPYAYVMSVKRYLSRGFQYDESPPPSAYPLESFLFRAKRGYCQQFAGAMAMLLRMGGVPARVATGFTTGSYDGATHSWIVADIDAHAWVEAWFPHYGWVRFDPTPAADPARGGHVPLPVVKSLNSRGSSPGLARRNPGDVTGPAVNVGHHGGGGASLLPLLVGVAVVLLAAGLALRATLRVTEPDADELLLELERALARCGRPLSAPITLATLEHRFRHAPAAEEYVRTLRLARFAGAESLPSPAQRRAFRLQLRLGLGLAGRARALWALPPQLRVRVPVWARPGRGIHSS